MFGPLLGVQMSFRVAGARDCAPCQKWAKRDGISKNHGRRGTFEEDLQRCIFRGRRSTRDMLIRDVRRSGRWFPKRVAFWSIRCSGLLRWFCVTGAALRMTWRHFCVAGATLWHMDWKNRKARGRQLCTQLSIFAGSLVELLRFWCCQLQKLRKFRRIASFLTISSSKVEEASQACCVFDVVKFKNEGGLAE